MSAHCVEPLACGFRRVAERRRVLTLIRCGRPHPRLTHPAGLIGSSVPPLIAHDPIVNLFLASYAFCTTTNFLSSPLSHPPSRKLFVLPTSKQHRPSNFAFGSNIEPPISLFSPTLCNTSRQDHLLRTQSFNYRDFSFLRFQLIRSFQPSLSFTLNFRLFKTFLSFCNSILSSYRSSIINTSYSNKLI